MIHDEPRIVDIERDIILRLNLRFVLGDDRPASTEPEPLAVSPSEAARMLGTSSDTVLRCLNEGTLPEITPRLSPRTRLIPYRALVEIRDLAMAGWDPQTAADELVRLDAEMVGSTAPNAAPAAPGDVSPVSRTSAGSVSGR